MDNVRGRVGVVDGGEVAGIVVNVAGAEAGAGDAAGPVAGLEATGGPVVVVGTGGVGVALVEQPAAGGAIIPGGDGGAGGGGGGEVLPGGEGLEAALGVVGVFARIGARAPGALHRAGGPVGGEGLGGVGVRHRDHATGGIVGMGRGLRIVAGAGAGRIGIGRGDGVRLVVGVVSRGGDERGAGRGERGAGGLKGGDDVGAAVSVVTVGDEGDGGAGGVFARIGDEAVTNAHADPARGVGQGDGVGALAGG